MAKRKATFIGSPEWVKRDVFIEEENGTLVVADVPSGIAIKSTILNENELLVALAHRVKQIGL